MLRKALLLGFNKLSEQRYKQKINFGRIIVDISTLETFHGYQSSFIPFSSGYYIYLASWDTTPTRFSSFSNLWVITPDDNRKLYADPQGTSPIVCIYHEFDEIHDAAISVEHTSANQLFIDCASLNGEQIVKVDLTLAETLGSRLIAGLSSSPPTPMKVSKPVIEISNFLVNLLVAKKGSKIYGRTETGMPYYHGATDRLFTINQGSLNINDEEMGTVTNPTWSLTFGDSVPFYNSVIKIGNLHIPYNDDLLNVKPNPHSTRPGAFGALIP
jgi:hypothetical protein